MCFSFCQLEFPFQIPFWLYDQATAVFMGGRSLAGGADLVRKEVYSFCRQFKQLQPSAGTQGECASDLGIMRTGRESGNWLPPLTPGTQENPLILLGFQNHVFVLMGMVHFSEACCGYLVR